jgi:hypothetical protein
MDTNASVGQLRYDVVLPWQDVRDLVLEPFAVALGGGGTKKSLGSARTKPLDHVQNTQSRFSLGRSSAGGRLHAGIPARHQARKETLEGGSGQVIEAVWSVPGKVFGSAVAECLTLSRRLGFLRLRQGWRA